MRHAELWMHGRELPGQVTVARHRERGPGNAEHEREQRAERGQRGTRADDR